MSGRVLLCWRYELLAKVARKRYLTSQEITRSIHGEIANLFFSEFSTDPQPKVEEACKLNVFCQGNPIFGFYLFVIKYVEMGNSAYFTVLYSTALKERKF